MIEDGFTIEDVEVSDIEFANFDFSQEQLYKMRRSQIVEDVIVYKLTHTQGYASLSVVHGEMAIFSSWGNWVFDSSRYPCHGAILLKDFIENVMVNGEKVSTKKQFEQLCSNKSLITTWNAFNEIAIRIIKNRDHELELQKIKEKMESPRY